MGKICCDEELLKMNRYNPLTKIKKKGTTVQQLTNNYNSHGPNLKFVATGQAWPIGSSNIEGVQLGLLNGINGAPPGLLAQVVPGHLSDLQLRGSSPCINNYSAKKIKRGINGAHTN